MIEKRERKAKEGRGMKERQKSNERLTTDQIGKEGEEGKLGVGNGEERGEGEARIKQTSTTNQIRKRERRVH